jgi:hypothetical protein
MVSPYLFFFLTVVSACAIVGRQTPIPHSPGLLKVSTKNPRYFMDSSGKTVLLSGHSGCPFLVQDGWGSTPTPADRFSAGNENLCRSWLWENSRWSDGKTGNVSDVNGLIHPLAFERTGPGFALDGAPKFDLTQFDESFFDRLRSGVIAAGRLGLYVDVMLFQGWSAYKGDGSSAWFGHYFNRANNINGIDGDGDGNGDGSEVFTLANAALTGIQEHYVRKMIDTLNDLDNVIWEIANEGPDSSKEWQYHMIDLIRSYEAGKPKQHPIGMTAYNHNDILLASAADWIAPGALSWDSAGDPYVSDPPVADARKVIISDVDHLGFSAFRDNGLALNWIWKTFTRGYNLLYQEMTAGIADTAGSVLHYANKMKLEQMTPQNQLSSTGYVLAHPGEEYLVYQPNGGQAFTLDLLGGSYSYEWFDPVAAKVVENGTLAEPSGTATFSAPFRGAAVLYLKIARPSDAR